MSHYIPISVVQKIYRQIPPPPHTYHNNIEQEKRKKKKDNKSVNGFYVVNLWNLYWVLALDQPHSLSNNNHSVGYFKSKVASSIRTSVIVVVVGLQCRYCPPTLLGDTQGHSNQILYVYSWNP